MFNLKYPQYLKHKEFVNLFALEMNDSFSRIWRGKFRPETLFKGVKHIGG